MKSIFRHDYAAPALLDCPIENIVLFPTNTEHYISDFEAVMASKKYLRLWSASDWPLDNFTADENKQDLQFHVDDNEDHTAYGYMIYTLDKKTALGSVYINPLIEWSRYHSLQSGQDPRLNFEARIDYWVRPDHPDMERKVLDILIPWFRDTWKVKVLFVSRPSLTERNHLYKNHQLKLHATFLTSESPFSTTWLFAS